MTELSLQQSSGNEVGPGVSDIMGVVVSFLQLIRFFIYRSSFHAVLFCCVLCFLFWRCLAGTFKGETRVVFSDIGASLGFRMPNQNHKD